jgi:hypothetical protein
MQNPEDIREERALVRGHDLHALEVVPFYALDLAVRVGRRNAGIGEYNNVKTFGN